MGGRDFATPRGARILGERTASWLTALDQNRTYNQTRPDLPLDPATLQPQQQVATEDLNFVADTMAYGDFLHISLTVAAAGAAATQVPILTRPANKRIFLMIQNTDATRSLFVGFGIIPSATIGLLLLPGQTLTLDDRVPQNDVYLAASSAGCTGLITYADQAYGKE